MKKIFVFLFGLAFPLTLISSEKDVCADMQTSQEVLECSRQSKSSSDKKLNDEYRELKLRIDKYYSQDQALKLEYLAALKSAQLAWIAYRDKICELEAFEVEKRSPAYESIINGCVSRMSDSQSTYLRETMK